MNREATARAASDTGAAKETGDGVERDELQVGAYASPSSGSSPSRSRVPLLLGVLFAAVAAILAIRLVG